MVADARKREFAAFERFTEIVGGRFGALGQPAPEEQNGDYEAGLTTIGSESWRLRTARVTPKKPGAFVAMWRRDERGETRPFDDDEAVAGLLLFVQDGEKFGVFRFTADHLESLGITSSSRRSGKRGFRAYPSWSTGLNPQATRTQRQQAEAFTDLSAELQV